MRQINADNVKGKGVCVMFYDFGKTENVLLEDSDADNVDFIKALGFSSIPTLLVNDWQSLKEAVQSRMNGMIQEIDGFNVLIAKDEKYGTDYPQAVCDGLVIKVNSRRKREEIGMSQKGPKWAFAFKFKPLRATTRIDHVEWQVGKTGRITPVAVFDEVSLGGTKITRATLNNIDYMQSLPVLSVNRRVWLNVPYDGRGSVVNIRYDQPIQQLEFIKPGDILKDKMSEKSQGNLEYVVVDKVGEDGFWIDHKAFGGEWYPFEKNRYFLVNQDKGLKMDDCIVVERSNDVIPRIVGIERHQTLIYLEDIEVFSFVEKRRASFMPPTHCPVCGHEVIERYPLHFCINPLCGAQLKGRLEHYCSRDAMNIVGLGSGIIDVLYEEGLIKTLPDIYTLCDHVEELKKLPKFGQKKIDKLLKSIEDSKTPELWQMLYALAMNGIGHKVSKELAQRYCTLDRFLQATEDELYNMETMGYSTVKTILDFIHDKETLQLLNELEAAGVKPKQAQATGDKYSGKAFVITGTLDHPRDHYVKIIENLGGKVSGSVSKKTFAVLIGADAGSKETKAKELIAKGAPLLLLEGDAEIEAFFNK